LLLRSEKRYTRLTIIIIEAKIIATILILEKKNPWLLRKRLPVMRVKSALISLPAA
jgi:hypothetical protein